jgi:hypothetical protein
MKRKNVFDLATEITQVDDINMTNDILVDISRKIFVHHYNKKYQKMEWALYQTQQIRHSKYTNVVVSPDFVRDDGVVIYLLLVHNGNYIKTIDKDILHVAMEILKIKNAYIFTIMLEPSINPNDMNCLTNINIAKSYTNITKKTYRYSAQSSQNYLAKFSNKKAKIMDDHHTNPINETPVTDFVRGEWISASKTRNYALKDTLVDWLDFCYDKSSEKETFNRGDRSTRNCNHNRNEYDFTKYIMKKGIQFETHVINLIKDKVKKIEFVTICTSMQNYDDNIMEYEEKTIKEIFKGTPIIYQAVLMNRTGSLSYSYGMPDLLVRSDYLHKIVLLGPLDQTMINFKAPNFKGNYHYVVVDIKYTTLKLCANGIHIRNSGSAPAYKCQLYIYNHALGKIQGYEPAISFVLGRKYKYESKGMIYSGNDCFDRFGHIEYSKWDKNYINETIKAISWIKKLRSEGPEWKLLPVPSVPELYPNMSSVSDTNWNGLKMEYANKIGEISLLWNCGVKNRKIAHANGIYSFFDDNCCSKILGIDGSKQAPILDEIICINKKRIFANALDRIHMVYNKNVNNKWLELCKLRISVDFEIINSVCDDFSELPKAQNYNRLFMIGLAYKVQFKSTKYKMFLAKELSDIAEYQIIHQFYDFLRKTTDKYLGKKMSIPIIHHWGHIERSFFSNLCVRLVKAIGKDIEEEIELVRTKLNWYDLSIPFKNNPIVINGCFKFGLKEIAKRLNELGLIKSGWPNNLCTNGNIAMVMAQKAYQTSKNENKPVCKDPIIKEIMAYNKIDCMIIHEIIELMQQKQKNIPT